MLNPADKFLPYVEYPGNYIPALDGWLDYWVDADNVLHLEFENDNDPADRISGKWKLVLVDD